MKKIKLNEDAGKITSNDEYILDPTEEYVIDIEKEMDERRTLCILLSA